MRCALFIGCLLLPTVSSAADPTAKVLFQATFDKSIDADIAAGDGRLYSAKTLQREGAVRGLIGDEVVWDAKAGRRGGALRFVRKNPRFIFYRGRNNLRYAKNDFAGTVSFWLRLTPDEDLPEGFVDPLQITDKKWNDASFFVDFTKDLPRTFRLGVFSDYKSWNPTDRKWDDVPEQERPLVNVVKAPFSRDKWTHVAFTFKHFNTGESNGLAELYLDGESQGTISRSQQVTWNPSEVAIWLGINYVGLLDELTIYDRALSASEVQALQ